MKNNYDKFYKENSKRFKKYAFTSKSELIKGEKPDFFKLIKKYSNKNFTLLDIGCSSGELTIKISPYFKKIIGIDPYKEYIKTAEKNRKNKKIKNVFFKIADGKKLPFENKYFDVIISSRGPLSSDIDFMKEGYRVLKDGGIMIEETIGEKDKLEIKKYSKEARIIQLRKRELI